MKVRFRRIWDAASGFAVHLSEDLRFALLPVMENSPAYAGWRVFEITTGELLEGNFSTLDEAKAEVERLSTSAGSPA